MKKDKLILINAGHGGLDAFGDYITAPDKRYQRDLDGVTTQINEGVLNRAVAYHLSFKLDMHGIKNTVINSNHDEPLHNITKRINAAYGNTDCILISIHHNYHDTDTDGAEVFTYSGMTPLSDAIAQKYGRLFKQMFPSRRLRTKAEACHYNYDGTAVDALYKKKNFWILRKSIMPSILTEFGFMSGRRDFSYISSDSGIADQVNLLYSLCRAYVDNAIEHN